MRQLAPVADARLGGAARPKGHPQTTKLYAGVLTGCRKAVLLPPAGGEPSSKVAHPVMVQSVCEAKQKQAMFAGCT